VLLRLLVAAPLFGAVGCAGGPGRALQTSADTAAQRAAQTRRFEGITQQAMLTAGAALLQDLGFTIEEADSRLGVLVGSKQHTAEERKTASQAILEVAGTVALVLAIGAITGQLAVGPSDDDPTDRQVIRVTLAIANGAAETPDRVLVSLTVNRVVYTRSNRVRSQESVHDPVLMQAFFEALSKSVFLEAHAT